jgi:hypothetical protein
MGRRRLKKILIRQIRYGIREKSKGGFPKGQTNPFDGPLFWLTLAGIDFYEFFGLGLPDNNDKWIPDKEHKK